MKYLNYSDYGYSDSDYYPEGLIFSETKLIILPQERRFSVFEKLLDSLTENGKLEYAPIFCSSWIVSNDNQVIKKMKNYLRECENSYPKTKEKREVRKQLRLNTWCCGWMAFQDKSIEDAVIKNPMLTNREQKWWQKGYDDAKKDYEQERKSDSDQYCNLLKLIEKDYDKAKIKITPYIFRNKIYTLIDGAENIILTKENFQSFLTLLENNHNALSVIVESGELGNKYARLDGTLYLTSLITFQEFIETIKPLLNSSIEDEINNWKRLGCQYINIDFSQTESYYHHNTSN
ncbi:hypothetical protein QMU85_002300 [Photobacterium damselae]|nr:hypothetical protein [Photobacterium damselae]